MLVVPEWYMARKHHLMVPKGSAGYRLMANPETDSCVDVGGAAPVGAGMHCAVAPWAIRRSLILADCLSSECGCFLGGRMGASTGGIAGMMFVEESKVGLGLACLGVVDYLDQVWASSLVVERRHWGGSGRLGQVPE